MQIEYKQIRYNVTPSQRTIKYIVIHDTGNFDVGADEETHFNYFNSADRNSSADFFIGKKILQVNDYTKGYTWHVGDGHNQYGINNRNSIGIEICVNRDGDYKKAVQNAIELVNHLLGKLNIPFANVVRHYDASRKNCPQTMNHNGNWSDWHNFKARLTSGGDTMNTTLETQRQLNKLGYGLVEDGISGANTRNAIVDFQGLFGLEADGIAGQKTNAKLDEVINRKTSSRPPF